MLTCGYPAVGDRSDPLLASCAPVYGHTGARARAVRYEFGTLSRCLVDQAARPRGLWPAKIRTSYCWSSDCRLVDGRTYPGAVPGSLSKSE